MGQVVTGTKSLTAAFVEQKTAGVLATQNLQLPIQGTIAYQNGTGAQQVDTVFAEKIALSVSTPVTIDLTNVTDPAGNTGVSFGRVREFFIQNMDPAAGHSIAVYSTASNGWAVLPPVANELVVQPNGGMIHIADPQSTGSLVGNVVTSTSKSFTINPGTNAISAVNILIVGGSTA